MIFFGRFYVVTTKAYKHKCILRLESFSYRDFGVTEVKNPGHRLGHFQLLLIKNNLTSTFEDTGDGKLLRLMILNFFYPEALLGLITPGIMRGIIIMRELSLSIFCVPGKLAGKRERWFYLVC